MVAHSRLHLDGARRTCAAGDYASRRDAGAAGGERVAEVRSIGRILISERPIDGHWGPWTPGWTTPAGRGSEVAEVETCPSRHHQPKASRTARGPRHAAHVHQDRLAQLGQSPTPASPPAGGHARPGAPRRERTSMSAAASRTPATTISIHWLDTPSR